MMELLNALGYNSKRTAEAGSVEEFLELFVPKGSLTDRQRNLFEPWLAVEIVFLRPPRRRQLEAVQGALARQWRAVSAAGLELAESRAWSWRRVS